MTSFTNSDLNKYPYILSWGDGITQCNTGTSGTIVKLEFKILDTFTFGSESIKVTVTDMLDMNLNDIAFTAKSASGTISISTEHEHTYGKWTTVTPATIAAKGVEKRECTVCGNEETRDIAKKSFPFTDVYQTDFYYDPVIWAVDHGITKGTSDTLFSPSEPCTRAQVVTFLWRVNGSPKSNAKNPLVDVPKTEYYYDAVLWAVGEGITNGTSATTFSPNDPCTRGQIVTFLWRANGCEIENVSNPFVDVTKGAFYYDAVQWAVKNEITKGTSAMKFSPEDTCTRGQIVTFLYRSQK